MIPGEYIFDGRDALELRGQSLRHWRHDVQAVFQNPWDALNPRLRVWQLITEPLLVRDGLRRRTAREQARRLLTGVGLPADLAERYPRQLSGGQRQRVAIARALSVRPRLLILDEPVSALDVSLRVQILTMIKEMTNQAGTALVYITHDLATVSYLATRVYVLYDGSIVEELPVRRLAEGGDDPYTQLLRSAVLDVDAPSARRQLSAAVHMQSREANGAAKPACK